MPIYEYQCKACGHKLEAIQKISDAPLRDCPSCTKGQLEKLVSASGFQLKGGGWYATDYSSKEKNKAKKGATEGESKKSSTEAKTDGSSSSGTTESK